MSKAMLEHCKQLEGATIKSVKAVEPDPEEFIDGKWMVFILQLPDGSVLKMIPSCDHEMNGPGFLDIEMILGAKKGGEK